MLTNVGIIGVGNMGRAHAANIAKGNVPHMHLAALCDIDPNAVAFCKKTYPDVPVFTSAEDMMKSGLIDSVIVAIPHYQHPEYVMMAVDHGLHVYCEKPAGVYSKQVKEMIAHCAEHPELVCSMGFQQRTHAKFNVIRDMIRSGKLGHIKKVIWIVTDWYRPQAYHDSSAWRGTWKYEGGGTIVNQNPHNIDLFQWLFGLPDEVMCTIDYGKYYNIEVDDDVTAIFRYKSGTVGIYTTSTGEQPGTNRLEISCDMGKLVLENNILTFWENEISEREFNVKNKEAFPHINCVQKNIEIPADPMQQHCAMLENFAAKVCGEDVELICPISDGINECLLANSMYYSDWQGQKWVSPKNFDDEGFYAALMQKVESSTYVSRSIAVENTDMESSF